MPATPPLITVLGAGSIGCWLGGRMTEGGARVRLIGRERFGNAISEHGLTLGATDRAPVVLRDVDFRTEPDALAGSDVVALCTKSGDTAEAAELINRHAPDAHVVSFQNGVGNLPVLDARGLRLSGAVVPFNVTSPAPGHFHRGTSGDLVIGPDAPQAMLDALRSAGVGVRVVDDVRGYLWAKLLVNLNNALNTLWGGALRDGLLQRGYRRVLIAMIKEGLAVARAEGVEVATFNGRSPDAMIRLMGLPDWLYRIAMDRVARIDPTARSSMLDDLELGRAAELDHLQGEIVRRGERAGVPTPVNRAVMAAVQEAFSIRKTPRLSGAQMQAKFLK